MSRARTWAVLLLALVLTAAGIPAAAKKSPDVKKSSTGLVLSGTKKQKNTRKLILNSPPLTDRNAQQAKAHPSKTDENKPACTLGTGDSAFVDTRCLVGDPPPIDPRIFGRPVRPSVRLITEVVVRQAVKNVEFPALTVQTQPRGRTLVNAKTIVYTKPFPVDDVVEILTWPVEVRATPVRYVWTFGDGTTLATQTEGSPYPALEIFHQYKKRGQVAVTVTVLYKARYKAPGLGWQAVNGTVAIPGPPTALTVAEAVPVLVAPER
jgi:hypothetical protein